MKRFTWAILIGALACGGSGTDSSPPPFTGLTTGDTVLFVGETVSLRTLARDGGGDPFPAGRVLRYLAFSQPLDGLLDTAAGTITFASPGADTVSIIDAATGAFDLARVGAVEDVQRHWRFRSDCFTGGSSDSTHRISRFSATQASYGQPSWTGANVTALLTMPGTLLDTLIGWHQPPLPPVDTTVTLESIVSGLIQGDSTPVTYVERLGSQGISPRVGTLQRQTATAYVGDAGHFCGYSDARFMPMELVAP